MVEFQGFAINAQGEPVLLAFYPKARRHQPFLKPDGTVGMNIIDAPEVRQLTAKNIAWLLDQYENAPVRDEGVLQVYSHFRHMLNTYSFSVNPQPAPRPMIAEGAEPQIEIFDKRATA